MKHLINKWYVALVLIAVGMLSGCDMMTESYDDCPMGLYLSFKYDYNLERSDIFKGNVGSVTVYVYGTSNTLVRTYDVPASELTLPFVGSEYWTLHISDLPEGEYRFIALAQQAPYAETSASSRAHFVRSGVSTGDSRESLTVKLDRVAGSDGTYYRIDNHSLPLDTLWHGMEENYVSVYAEKPTYDTISLVRDTKQIHLSLRELDDPTTMDIANYGMTITDRNSVILYDNSLDESDYVVYTPYTTWNSEDRTTTTDAYGNELEGVGKIGHADFMTSRLLYHASAGDDGVLSVTNLTTGVEVAALNLPDILARLRNSDDLHRYSEQEFLDRGYDYSISIFLRGDKLSYITIEIDILGWSRRIQYEDL